MGMKKSILILIATLNFTISGCVLAPVERDWRKAQRSGTIKKYKNFVWKYPDSKYIKQAREKIEKIHFKDAVRTDSKRSYFEFLYEFPYSIYKKKVIERLSELVIIDDDLSQLSELISINASNSDSSNDEILNDVKQKHFELEEFLRAKNQNTLDSYNIFLKTYPDNRYSEVAKINVALLNAISLNTVEAYIHYLGNHYVIGSKILWELEGKEIARNLYNNKEIVMQRLEDIAHGELKKDIIDLQDADPKVRRSAIFRIKEKPKKSYAAIPFLVELSLFDRYNASLTKIGGKYYIWSESKTNAKYASEALIKIGNKSQKIILSNLSFLVLMRDRFWNGEIKGKVWDADPTVHNKKRPQHHYRLHFLVLEKIGNELAVPVLTNFIDKPNVRREYSDNAVNAIRAIRKRM